MTSPIQAVLTGLVAGTKYYYKAYVIEGGEYRYGDVQNFTTKKVATATVTTKAATGIGSTTAVLNGSFSGATGTIADYGFRYRKSGTGNWTTVGLNGTTATSANYSMDISSLEPSTTYEFQAFVVEFDENENTYKDRFAGNTLTFTTAELTSHVPSGWLELPATTGSEYYVGTFYGSGGNTEANRNYTYYYSDTYYASLWTAYPLTLAHKTGSASTSGWDFNPNIPQNKQVNITGNSYGVMYGNDTYSRGHQCPNADRKSNQQMNTQTYYATNQTPQIQLNFNQGVWSSLEDAERNLVTKDGEIVYVVTGPAYRTVGGNETITYLHGATGKNANPTELPIPNYFWKAFLKVKMSGNEVQSATAIGFWFEHKTYTNDSYTNHAVSVDYIEQKIGFDLFTNLPNDVEATAEANTSWNSFRSFSNISSVTDIGWGVL